MEETLEVPVKKPRAKRKVTAKGLGMKALLAKRYKMLADVPDLIKKSFGDLPERILMGIYGPAKNGKSRLTMDFIKILMPVGQVLYWGLEEGHNLSMQRNVRETLDEKEHAGKIIFYDHTLTFEMLVFILKKKSRPRTVVIDSLQYSLLTEKQYKYLKETFLTVSFIILSHAQGKKPKGGTAAKIIHDVDIIVRVEGKVAFVDSRHGGGYPYIIWEEGAIRYWTKKKVNQFKKQ